MCEIFREEIFLGGKSERSVANLVQERYQFRSVKMRAIVLVSVLCAGLASAFPQQAIDPAYLRQYYQQIASQAGAQGGAAQQRADAIPIYEQGAQEQQHVPQYLSQGQQLRVRDNVQDQVRSNSIRIGSSVTWNNSDGV